MPVWFNCPKEQQAWYYQSMAKALAQRKEHTEIRSLIIDFSKQVKAVFGST